MAILTKPAQFAAGTLTVAAINALMNTIYNEFGSAVDGFGGTGAGNITDANCAGSMALGRSKVADIAVVCNNAVSAGTQTIVRPTKWSAAAQKQDWVAGNTGNIAVTAATGYPIVANKSIIRLTTDNAARTVTTLTGASVGDMIFLIVDNTLAAASVFTLTHTAANTADAFRLVTQANRTTAATLKASYGTFVYGNPLGEANNMWWEV